MPYNSLNCMLTAKVHEVHQASVILVVVWGNFVPDIEVVVGSDSIWMHDGPFGGNCALRRRAYFDGGGIFAECGLESRRSTLVARWGSRLNLADSLHSLFIIIWL
jgi:hypothetical protein